ERQVAVAGVDLDPVQVFLILAPRLDRADCVRLPAVEIQAEAPALGPHEGRAARRPVDVHGQRAAVDLDEDRAGGRTKRDVVTAAARVQLDRAALGGGEVRSVSWSAGGGHYVPF